MEKEKRAHVGREVGEEVWVLPMRDAAGEVRAASVHLSNIDRSLENSPRQDDTVKVVRNVAPLFAFLGNFVCRVRIASVLSPRSARGKHGPPIS